MTFPDGDLEESGNLRIRVILSGQKSRENLPTVECKNRLVDDAQAKFGSAAFWEFIHPMNSELAFFACPATIRTMIPWLQRSIHFSGSALFRGTWPLRKENFEHLRALGIDIADGEQKPGWHWSLNLKHPAWGEATLVSARDVSLPPHALIEWDAQLIPNEVEEIKSCATTVQLYSESRKNNVLRDRKSALHFLNAILGEEGLAAMDHIGQKIWSRDALSIENAHSADLDVDGIMTYHWVSEDDSVPWLHSHGLGEIGFYDFDILNPSPDLRGHAYDLLRCIAFNSVEGNVQPGSTFRPLSSTEIRCMAAEEFMEKASPQHAELRHDSEGHHDEKRVVLCDPAGGLLKTFFGGRPYPSRALSAPYPENSLIGFSSTATELMAQRARASFPFFMTLAGEMAALARDIPGFQSSLLIKLGYKTDQAKDDTDREHMWFEYHGMNGDRIDATLLNQPFNISSMKEGQRKLHKIEVLTDWTVFTPAGKITPSFNRALRFIRRNTDRLREALKSAPPAPSPPHSPQ